MILYSRKKKRKSNQYGNYIEGVLLSEYLEQIKWKDKGLILKTTINRKEYLEMKKRINGIK
jgi:hypothetical protein